mgnify:CR=1 FL=1
MTNDEFNESMAMLFSYYPNKKFDPVLSRLYHGRFIHLSYNDFYNGVNNHIDDERYEWFPSIPQLKSFMPEPTPSLMIEENLKLLRNKETQDLIDKYHPDTGSYFKSTITNEATLKANKL